MRRSGHHVYLGVPTRGQIGWQTATALEAARDYTPGLRPIHYEAGNLSVALVRNRIVKSFLATDCSVLAMVDDDIAPPINFVEMLDPFVPEFAMVSLPHPMPHPADQGVQILSVYDVDNGGMVRPCGLDPGINEIGATATGCVLIDRKAIERLGPAPFRIAHDPDAPIKSDDFLFCADLRDAGFKIGCFWEGVPLDHFRTVSLAPLIEAQTLRKEYV